MSVRRTTQSKKYSWFCSSLVFASLAICNLSQSAQGQGNPNPGVVPIQAKYAGKSYAEWAAAWWQWTYANFTINSPENDTTGANVAVGQSGHVWFLTWGFSPVIERTASIPAGTALFMPCISFDTIWSYPFGAPLDTLKSTAESFLPFVANPVVEVDGVGVSDLTSYRVVSTPYLATVPQDVLPYFLPPGTYGPVVSAGYWVLLTPLPVGQHTIRLAWDIQNTGWNDGHFEMKYHLTVTPGK